MIVGCPWPVGSCRGEGGRGQIASFFHMVPAGSHFFTFFFSFDLASVASLDGRTGIDNGRFRGGFQEGGCAPSGPIDAGRRIGASSIEEERG